MRALRYFLPAGLALALSSCDVFRPDPPQQPPPNQAYGAASPYDTNNAGGYNQPAGNPYGQPSGAYAPPSSAGGAYGAYNPPNSNPYTQPADSNPYSNGGAYKPPGGNTGGGNYSSASGRTHTVASGDTLGKIARRYGVTTEALMRANNLTNPDYVRAGQTLTIP